MTPTTDATTKKPKQLAFCNDFLSNNPISPATIPNNNANIVPPTTDAGKQYFFLNWEYFSQKFTKVNC